MVTFIYYILGFGYLGLFIWGLVLTKTNGVLNLTNILLLVLIGLIYDNFIIALGGFIGEGSVLENLSRVRYWMHALFTPLLILFAWKICFVARFPWAQKTIWNITAYLITSGLIIYELFISVKGLKLNPDWKNGILTYENAVQSSNPFMVIVITIILGLVGLLLLKKRHFIWLFIGTLIMLFGALVAVWVKTIPIINISEFLLIGTLLITKQYFVQKSSKM